MLTGFKRTKRLLNTANDELNRPIIAKQDDINGRTLKIQITDDGVIKDLTGANVYLAWVHESCRYKGIEPFIPITPTTGIFELEYPNHMLQPGVLRAYISICYNSRIVNTLNFTITVQDDLGIQDSIAQEDQMFMTLKETIDYFYRVVDAGNGIVDEYDQKFTAQLAQQQADWDALKDNVEAITGVVAITTTEVDGLF